MSISPVFWGEACEALFARAVCPWPQAHTPCLGQVSGLLDLRGSSRPLEMLSAAAGNQFQIEKLPGFNCQPSSASVLLEPSLNSIC